MTATLGYVRIIMGGVLVVFGLLSIRYPYEISRFEEMIDAIGSTRRAGDVEPAAWKVTLTRIGGIVLVLFGLLWTLPGWAKIL